MRLPLVVCLLALCAAAPAAAQAPKPVCPGADVPVARDASGARDAVLCIVNAERAVRGLPALAGDARLDAASERHSRDMADRRYFDHVSPDGGTPAERGIAAGYPWQAIGENIAMGQQTPREAMMGWMRSPGHCRGVLEPQVVHTGLGVVAGARPLWTQMFGLPEDTAPPSADTAPAEGCPYERLSIAPGPATVLITALRRSGRRVAVAGLLRDEGAGRRLVVTVRRRGRSARRTIVTRAGGVFRTTVRAPRRGSVVKVTVTAPAVPDVYKTGRDSHRI